ISCVKLNILIHLNRLIFAPMLILKILVHSLIFAYTWQSVYIQSKRDVQTLISLKGKLQLDDLTILNICQDLSKLYLKFSDEMEVIVESELRFLRGKNRKIKFPEILELNIENDWASFTMDDILFSTHILYNYSKWMISFSEEDSIKLVKLPLNQKEKMTSFPTIICLEQDNKYYTIGIENNSINGRRSMKNNEKQSRVKREDKPKNNLSKHSYALMNADKIATIKRKSNYKMRHEQYLELIIPSNYSPLSTKFADIDNLEEVCKNYLKDQLNYPIVHWKISKLSGNFTKMNSQYIMCQMDIILLKPSKISTVPYYGNDEPEREEKKPIVRKPLFNYTYIGVGLVCLMVLILLFWLIGRCIKTKKKKKKPELNKVRSTPLKGILTKKKKARFSSISRQHLSRFRKYRSSIPRSTISNEYYYYYYYDYVDDDTYKKSIADFIESQMKKSENSIVLLQKHLYRRK
ncbi:hypothetical protein SNEBB_000638, partial [Seison nebaliae]